MISAVFIKCMISFLLIQGIGTGFAIVRLGNDVRELKAKLEQQSKTDAIDSLELSRQVYRTSKAVVDRALKGGGQ